jgi:hypothetical protein
MRQFEEAGHAFARARHRGVDCDPDLDALAPSLDQLSVQSAHELPRATLHVHLAWSRDGKTLFASIDSNIVALTLEDGAVRLLEPTLAPIDAGETGLLVARRRADVHELVLGDRVVGGRHKRVDALRVFGPRDEGIVLADRGAIVWYRTASPERVFSTRARRIALGATGHVVVLRGKGRIESVAFLEPFSRDATRSYDLDSLGDEMRFMHEYLGYSPSEFLLEAPGRRASFVRAWRDRVMSVLVEPGGSVLGVASVPAPDGLPIGATASPSGRLVCVSVAPDGIGLLDVIARESRVLPWDHGHALGCAWSPSGRRLALATSTHVVIVGVPP